MEICGEANFWQKIWKLTDATEIEFDSGEKTVALIVYSILSFSIPLIFKQPQVLVGSFVNMMLVLSALHLKGKNLLPIIIFPSIGAVVGGYLFGGLTVHMFYLVPFIWIANSILILTFKHFNIKKKNNFFLTLGLGSFAKAGFLFGITFLLVSFSIVPEMFLIAMGAIQLLTAVSGGIFAFAVKESF